MLNHMKLVVTYPNPLCLAHLEPYRLPAHTGVVPKFFFIALPPSHEHMCSFRIVVVEEKTFARVERGDSLHIPIRK